MKIYNAETTTVEPRSKGYPWTSVQLMVLKENYLEMSDADLASILHISESGIRKKLRELELERPKVPKPPKPPKPPRPRQVRQKTAKQLAEEQRKAAREEQKRTRLQREKEMELRRKKEQEKRLQTRQQDFSRMRTVRIDAKTWIYVKEGDDVEKLKKKYHRELSKAGLSKIQW